MTLVRRALTMAAIVMSMLLPTTVTAEAQRRLVDESQVKAAFLDQRMACGRRDGVVHGVRGPAGLRADRGLDHALP